MISIVEGSVHLNIMLNKPPKTLVFGLILVALGALTCPFVPLVAGSATFPLLSTAIAASIEQDESCQCLYIYSRVIGGGFDGWWSYRTSRGGWTHGFLSPVFGWLVVLPVAS